MKLQEALDLARPLDMKSCEAARQKWDDIAKPLRSLGRLEELVIQLAGIRETLNPKVDKKAVLIFCADNGIVEEGITQTSSEVTGKGAGLTSKGVLRKIEKIKEAININKPVVEDVIDVLSKLGGYDICGMVGAYIGAAVYRLPIIIDGFISAVAANCAIRLLPVASDYMFASHCSAEPAGELALKVIHKKAYIECEMCLGEGTGAVIGGKLFDFALAAYNEIADFETACIAHYELLS